MSSLLSLSCKAFIKCMSENAFNEFEANKILNKKNGRLSFDRVFEVFFFALEKK